MSCAWRLSTDIRSRLRIWHRACPELNVSGEDRMAIIQATMPRFVRPKDGVRHIMTLDPF